MKTVSVFNREQIKQLKPIELHKVALVSIETNVIVHEGKTLWSYSDNDKLSVIRKWPWAKSCTLVFEDIDFEKHDIYKSFSWQQAQWLVEFLQDVMAKDLDLYVHCDAGMSRSVAVAKFCQDVLGFEVKLHAHPSFDLHNRLVYRKLNEAYIERMK